VDTLTILALATPLLAAGLLGFPASRAPGLRLAPWAALPALALAIIAADAYTLELPWLLLGSRLGLDATGRLFLLFTALLWLTAGVYARSYLAGDARRHVFTAFFLITLAGNLGVCLAQDAASFYLAFAVMSFATYGLVVHAGGAEARRAARVYLVMAVLGETLLLAGLLLLAGAAQTHFLPDMMLAPASDTAALAYGLLFVGFGVKAGVPLLHMWLPLAHPVAPTPASAVLSGAMIKAGLLGWLRFLPLGAAAMPDLGAAMLGLGLFAAFYGVATGLAQRRPKTLLAYSSLSQMGFITLAVGAGLLAPGLWPLLLPAVVLYALHHALAKAALFLGVGVAERCGASRRVLLGLALPALALAGAPLTSGMLVKGGLKAGLADLPAPWADLLAALLPLAALGTALLMVRLLWLVGRDTPTQAPSASAAGLLVPWLALLLALAGLVWALAPQPWVAQALSIGALLDAAWPPLAAAALGVVALRLRWRAPTLPPGDVLVPLLWGLAYLRRRAPALPKWRIALPAGARAAARLPQRGSLLRAWGTAGALWLALLAAVIALLAGG
jgi:formate hydrogenlyase subunit 3/multisubunit Na+/H+ antiporter MnhD subunit